MIITAGCWCSESLDPWKLSDVCKTQLERKSNLTCCCAWLMFELVLLTEWVQGIL
jgi:hypothetical protein